MPANLTVALKNIPAGQNEIKVPVNLAANAAVGPFTLTITGKAKHNTRDYTVNTTVPLIVKK